jgi:hypothetical protein
MTRSADAPTSDDHDLTDPVLARLRAARPGPPDGVLSPHSPASRALLDDILAGRTGMEASPRPAPAHRSRRRLAGRAAAVAAVAAAAAGAVVVAPFGSSGPTAAALVRDAAAASEQALGTGRAALTIDTETIDGVGGSADDERWRDSFDYVFAGDDVAVTMDFDGRSGGERRIVDGELYWRVDHEGRSSWFHQTDVTGPDLPAANDFTADPRLLLAALAPAAAFEIAGDERLDGVDVTHLRATTPDDIDGMSLGLADAMTGYIAPDTPEEFGTSEITALDLWVDGDDVVRRIDIAITTTSYHTTMEVLEEDPSGVLRTGPETTVETTQATTASLRFTDIGQVNTVVPPAEYTDVDVTQMANPPPL